MLDLPQYLGRHLVFVVGPMCGINRVSSEPPSHYECAAFAAENCPFLAHPRMRRNMKDAPATRHAAGFAIERNPGVTLLWVTDSYKAFKVRGGGGAGAGALFELGTPTRVEFWSQGRLATRAEIDESVGTGLPLLEEKSELDGEEGKRELRRQVAKFRRLLDEAVPA